MGQPRVDNLDLDWSGPTEKKIPWIRRPLRIELSCENLAWIAVILGVAFRVWEYLEFRALYMDESALLKNLVGRSIFDFQQVLEQDQMAPPGFLVIERFMVRLPLEVSAAGRLFPLACGVASVFFMNAAAWRYLDRRAVPIAVALFALGDHLLYYSAEIKQYSCDLALALAALLLAAPRPPEELTRRRFFALLMFGLVAPWLSFPLVFVLAGVGLHLLFSRMMRKDWTGAAIVAGMGLGWLVSFAGCFVLSRSILSTRDFIWVWWNFAFLPIPPRSLAELSLLGETLANVFINPGSLLSPFSLVTTAVVASILALLGCVSLARRWPGGFFLVIGPLLFALVASALHQYPFHGRLLLYLVPTYILLLSEGIAAVSRPFGQPLRLLVTLLLAAFFLYGQAAEILWHKAIQRRARPFDSHGDLKNDLLDYLEYQRRGPQLPQNQVRPPDS
jgi:hypothetical protein